ncbi:ABC transporter ATP-binding protein [bacterium]|nr:ABC transporter ATP-binding protein [bacterium]
MLLTARDLQHSFGVRPLFKELTFVVEKGDRIGLIGPNGAGKSTLFKILSGRLVPEKGEMSLKKGLKVGFLEQTPQLNLNASVEETLLSGAKDPLSSEAQAAAWEWMSKLALDGQGISGATPIHQLSGGWHKKIALVRELIQEPELLLLDEPTNHLDIESILWLEELIQKSHFAVMVITHDRVFLQNVTNRMMELNVQYPQGVLSVSGDYSTYLELRESQLSQQRAEEVTLKNKLRRETEWLRRGAKARTTKQQARIQRAHELMNEVDELEFRNRRKELSLDFQTAQKQPNRLIEARNISKAYGEKSLFSDFSVFIGPGSRVGLLGRNGCGKSSLIRCLLGTEPVDEGTIVRADQLPAAYFEQKRESLDLQQTVQKTLCPGGDSVIYRGKPIHIRSYLDRFLFSREQIDLPVGKLSGGEQSRLLLARLMLQEAKVLVLDEPTNDLDIETLDVLETCLSEFEGAVILVTHDRYFLDQVANQIIAFPDFQQPRRSLEKFANLSQWEAWHTDHLAALKVPVRKAAPIEAPPKKRKLSYNETRELASMENKIQEVEAQIASLEAELAKPEIQSQPQKLTELYQKLHEAQELHERLFSRWAELEALAN